MCSTQTLRLSVTVLKLPKLGVVVHTLVIPTLGRLRQKACEFEASLGYIAIPYLKTKQSQRSVTHTYK
jgi:hypothetical protein